MGSSMHMVLGIKRGLTPGRICAVLFVLLFIVGCVISPRRTFGGGPTPTPTPTGSPTPTPPVGTGKLYVSNGGASSILRFDDALTAGGNVVPSATISGAKTTLNGPGFITLDVVADRLYVANNADLSILIFDNISTKNGNVAPERTIAGGLTTLVSPMDVSLDSGRNLLYVADGDIRVFSSASTASGNIAPARTLNTTFAVSRVFIDPANDRLYAADPVGNAIAIFDNASTLNGPVTANRTIQGAATHLASPSGIRLDGLGRLVISNAAPPSITIYANAATANGNMAPAAEIAGSSTGMSVPNQIVINTSGTGSLYNADPGAARIAIFANLATATGNIAPTRAIVGPGTGLTVAGQPVGVALDTTR